MPNSSRKAGRLFVVATPIGNLADITYRAVRTLQSVDLIAAEDTRHSQKLLQNYAIRTPVVAYHDHNEVEKSRQLLERLLLGDDIAVISDAGTPLISDPGYRLVHAAHDRGVTVIPVPGCCAAIAGLSASGLATDRFTFEGFLPRTRNARRKRLGQLCSESRTLVFYESAHRIEETLDDLVDVFGVDRSATIARELTKQYETIKTASLGAIRDLVRVETDQKKGEFVVLVGGGENNSNGVALDVIDVLKPLMIALPLKQAVTLATQITGRKRNEIYAMALKHKEDGVVS